MRNKKNPNLSIGIFYTNWRGLHTAEAGVDSAKDTTNSGPEEHQGCDNNNSYQNKNQSIFNKTLTFFFRGK